MAGPQPPAGGDNSRWHDRDTEPIPRARPSQPEPDDFDEPYVADPTPIGGGCHCDGPPPLDYQERPSFTEDEFSGVRGGGGATEAVDDGSKMAALDDEASP